MGDSERIRELVDALHEVATVLDFAAGWALQQGNRPQGDKFRELAERCRTVADKQED